MKLEKKHQLPAACANALTPSVHSMHACITQHSLRDTKSSVTFMCSDIGFMCFDTMVTNATDIRLQVDLSRVAVVFGISRRCAP